MKQTLDLMLHWGFRVKNPLCYADNRESILQNSPFHISPFLLNPGKIIPTLKSHRHRCLDRCETSVIEFYALICSEIYIRQFLYEVDTVIV